MILHILLQKIQQPMTNYKLFQVFNEREDITITLFIKLRFEFKQTLRDTFICLLEICYDII